MAVVVMGSRVGVGDGGGGVSMLMVWVLLPESGLNRNVVYIFL